MPKTQLELFFRFLKFIFPYRWRWAAILILSGINSLLSLVNPYLAKLVIDKAIGNKDIRLFIILALIGGSVFLLDAFIGVIKQWLERYIKVKVGFDLNRKVYKELQYLSFAWFQDKSTGENLYKISYDIERIRDFITTIPPQAASVFPQLILTLVIIFRLDWRMSVLALCLAPFLQLPYYYFSRKMRVVWQTLIENSQDVFKGLQEILSHIQLVKVFGLETHSVRKYLKGLIAGIRIEIKNLRIEITNTLAGQLASKIIIGLITCYGVYEVIKGKMTFGTYSAIMVYLAQLMGLQGQFAHFFQTTAMGLVSCQRIVQILDEPKEKTQGKAIKAFVFKRGDLAFRNVSFGYQKQKYVLKNISFNMTNAGHVALVGPSGCGKTTVLNLILRLYEPWEGRILVDAYDIKSIEPGALKKQIGVALQEPFLWNDTVENNIRYGRGNATQKEMADVVKIIGIDGFIRDLPLGYATVIGENACKISEGQKQRIAIARALIKKPRILILDEAMSSMDSASEEKILASLKKFKSDMIMIVVSHRLSAVMHAEKVFYLKSEDRMIIDTPQSLLRNDQDFIRLFAGQESITPNNDPKNLF